MKLGNFLQDNLPVTKGSVKIPIAGLIEQYRKEYNAFQITDKSPFHYKVYTVSPGDRRVVHVKVPSETVRNFYYDVLFELEYTTTTSKYEDCDVYIFSNSPSFVYTYAYVFYHLDLNSSNSEAKKKRKTGMLINTLSNKIPRERLLMAGTEKTLPDQVLKSPPVVRNALGLPLWDKSLYYAIFYLMDKVQFSIIKSTATKITEADLMRDIMDFDTLMEHRKAMAKRQREAKSYRDKQIEKQVRKAGKKVTKPKRAMNAIKPIQATAAKKPVKAKGPSKPKRFS